MQNTTLIQRPMVFLLWAASLCATAWLSLGPAGPPASIPHLDKIIHAATYCWLALLPMRAFGQRNAAVTAAWGMLFYGAGIEIAQHFIPGRDASMLDMLANTVGVIAGVRIGHRWKMRDYLKSIGRA